MSAPIFKSDKPTYYFNQQGESVTYLEHAEFIAGNSYLKQNSEDGLMWWYYPMLDFRDKETHYEVHLIITSYNCKPQRLEDWLNIKDH